MRMRVTSSIKAHRVSGPRTDFWYLEPILCPSVCVSSTSTGHYTSAPHPLGGGMGETPTKGLISGFKAGPAGLSMELTQEQRGNDREEEKNAFIPTLTDSFNHSLTYSFNKELLHSYYRHCAQLKRGHSFT